MYLSQSCRTKSNWQKQMSEEVEATLVLRRGKWIGKWSEHCKRLHSWLKAILTDALDTEGVWNVAQVLQHTENELHIRYDGWPTEHDEDIPLGRIAPLHYYTSISKCVGKWGKKYGWWPALVNRDSPFLRDNLTLPLTRSKCVFPRQKKGLPRLQSTKNCLSTTVTPKDTLLTLNSTGIIPCK